MTRGGDRVEEIAFWNQFAKADTFGSLIQPDPDLTTRLAGHLETLDDSGDMLKANAIDQRDNDQPRTRGNQGQKFWGKRDTDEMSALGGGGNKRGATQRREPTSTWG